MKSATALNVAIAMIQGVMAGPLTYAACQATCAGATLQVPLLGGWLYASCVLLLCSFMGAYPVRNVCVTWIREDSEGSLLMLQVILHLCRRKMLLRQKRALYVFWIN